MVGSLMYITFIRLDIMHSVSLISHYMKNLSKNHLLAAKRIFHYLKGTIDFGIIYKYQKEATIIYYDNILAIKISKSLFLYGGNKQIDVRHHFIHNLWNGGVICLVFCNSESQVADILTKPLKQVVFEKLRRMLGVCSSKEAAIND
ncbi:hypothetical protein ES319_A10G185200v1 [Gossypium barbadense]|uniref:Reverse transcriptase Ty1/copia-type domain-containing protein n=2 Tax=Gossypium TaxID=3633 RepID=A0A5J5U4Z9_GOSBA|nr:hypothetical protein ES319_A10G185200v1 [Gossypium barbadense]TYG99594.1 hypothetical protein ES288_A10G207200v1 [Gossypium darwinii]